MRPDRDPQNAHMPPPAPGGNTHAIVYTAIFGAHDTLKDPAPQDKSCEFFCFTDADLPARVGKWRVICVRRDHRVHPRMQAKRFKLLSQEIFPGGRLGFRYAPLSRGRRADLSIWIDGSLQIKSSTFVRDMRAALDGGNWAMFTHPDRDCIYAEAEFSATLGKYQGLPLLAQVETYRPTVPSHGGLFACGVIVRREPAPERMKLVNQLWWEENVRWSYQDQISLPYAIHKSGNMIPRSIPGHLRRNIWFDIVPHHTKK